MISKFTFRATFLLLLLISVASASAEVYPVYLAGGGTVTLGPQESINAGDSVIWVETTGGVNNIVKNGTHLDKNYTTPAGLSVGEHTYRVHLISADPAHCIGDPSVEYKIYVLPSTTIALNDPTAPLYCENVPTATSSFVATATPASALPDSITYAYTWMGTKDGVSVADITTWGDPNLSADTKSCEFVFDTKTVGKYTLTAQLKYVVPAGSLLKTADNAGDVKTSAPKPVEVSAKPQQPTIVVM